MRLLLIFAIAVSLIAALSVDDVHAFDPNSPAAVNLEPSGTALKGFDPVAYFATGSPTPGNETISAEAGGATYLFVSPENRDAFLADPDRYLPAYGGFCALAMSFGKKVDIDPEAWKIVDGRLYVQANPRAATVWEQDIQGNIGRADDNWPRVMDRAPADL